LLARPFVVGVIRGSRIQGWKSLPAEKWKGSRAETDETVRDSRPRLSLERSSTAGQGQQNETQFLPFLPPALDFLAASCQSY
jgi:hypothetical protein